LDYIKSSTHVTGSRSDTYWQSGDGNGNAFIKALAEAFEDVYGRSTQ
jgi:hypothetical protein